MRALVFTLMCMLAAAASAATIYKWVDENGVTHYSDQPHPGAQKIQVQAVQTYKAPAAQRTAPYALRNAAPAGPVYSSCAVTRPTSQEMFQNTQTVPASVHVDPGLRAGDRVAVLLDGAPVASTIPIDSEVAAVREDRHAISRAVCLNQAPVGQPVEHRGGRRACTAHVLSGEVARRAPAAARGP